MRALFATVALWLSVSTTLRRPVTFHVAPGGILYRFTMLRRSLFVAALIVASMPAFADCPAGQVPGHDRNGNRACISTENQNVVALDAIQDAHCSPGYERFLDPQGRYVCIDKKTGVNANPRRANCPPGTWLKTDGYGYERCFPVP